MSAPTLMSPRSTASARSVTSAPSLLRHLPLPDTCPPAETGALDTLAERPTARRAQAAPVVQGVLRLVGAGGATEDDFGPVATRRADLPDPLAWSRGLVQVLVEVMSGRRAASQLLRWTTPSVYEQVRRLAALPGAASAAGATPSAGAAGATSTRTGSATRRPTATRRAARPPALQRSVVTSVRVCEPADGVAEVSAVVSGPVRSRAVALRLEGRDGRWKVTALESA